MLQRHTAAPAPPAARARGELHYSSPSSTLYDNSLITAGAAPAAKGEL